MYRFWHIVFSGLYVLLPCLLIFFQPDMGSVLILIMAWLAILIISGIKIRHFLILFLCALVVFVILWQFFLKDYQKERVLDFIFPYDFLATSWSQNQSEIAIGSGLIFGQGFTKGSQVQYGFLPEPHTDFIFAVIAQDFGLLGVFVLFFLYILLLWRIIKIAVLSRSNFSRLFISGFAVVLIVQFFINIGMNIGILPVIGIYLPLVSYGGSGLLGTFAGLGILQSIKIRS